MRNGWIRSAAGIAAAMFSTYSMGAEVAWCDGQGVAPLPKGRSVLYQGSLERAVEVCKCNGSPPHNVVNPTWVLADGERIAELQTRTGLASCILTSGKKIEVDTPIPTSFIQARFR